MRYGVLTLRFAAVLGVFDGLEVRLSEVLLMQVVCRLLSLYMNRLLPFQKGASLDYEDKSES